MDLRCSTSRRHVLRLRRRGESGAGAWALLSWIALLAVAVLMAQNAFATGSQVELVLSSRLHVLRTAIDSYWCQHDGFPARDGVEDTFHEQLLQPTDRRGRRGEGPTFGFGPYLGRRGVPDNPLVENATVKIVDRMPDVPTGWSAWIYCSRTGEIRSNVTGVGDDGQRWYDL